MNSFDDSPLRHSNRQVRINSAHEEGYAEPKPRKGNTEVYAAEQRRLAKFGKNPERHNQQKFKQGETLEININLSGDEFALALIDKECKEKQTPPVDLLEEIEVTESRIDFPADMPYYPGTNGYKCVIFANTRYTNIKFNVSTEVFSGSYEHYIGNIIGKVAYSDSKNAIMVTPVDEDASDRKITINSIIDKAYQNSDIMNYTDSKAHEAE